MKVFDEGDSNQDQIGDHTDEFNCDTVEAEISADCVFFLFGRSLPVWKMYL